MTAAPDVLSDTLNLLKDSWQPENTNDITPLFTKITTPKRYDFNENKTIVIAHRATTEINPAGIGESDKHEFENFDIDIRTLGEKEEGHWLNVIKEAKRIFKLKKVNPLTGTYLETHVLEFDGSGVDLSDKTHWLWRKIIPVQFKRYLVER